MRYLWKSLASECQLLLNSAVHDRKSQVMRAVFETPTSAMAAQAAAAAMLQPGSQFALSPLKFV